jgi:predicted lipoprotein with Yx(FWY)xxD motif
MIFKTIQTHLGFALVMGFASLLSACGGDGDNKKTPNDYSPVPSSASSIAPASSSSSLASSLLAASSAAASSTAALVPPVAWVDATVNGTDGNYLVAKGEVASALPEDSGNTSFKEQWSNRDGFALYTFAKDGKGVSTCAGTCLANWPPLLAGANDKANYPYSIIERSLGSTSTARQWAYQGMPLYFFKNDTATGHTNGKAIANWQLARPIPVTLQNDATKGEFLIGKGYLLNSQGMADQSKSGFTLYTFAKDTTDQSNCGTTCIGNWPPLYAAAEAQSAGDFSVITRSDASKQWAYKGRPLYFYTGDSAAGDIKGEITNWSLATTAVNAGANSSSPASSSATSSYAYSSSSVGYGY